MSPLGVASVLVDSSFKNTLSPVYCHFFALLQFLVLALYVCGCLLWHSHSKTHCQILKLIHYNMALLLVMLWDAAYGVNIIWHLEHFCGCIGPVIESSICAVVKTYLTCTYCFYLCNFHFLPWIHCSGPYHYYGFDLQCNFVLVDLFFCHLGHAMAFNLFLRTIVISYRWNVPSSYCCMFGLAMVMFWAVFVWCDPC